MHEKHPVDIAAYAAGSETALAAALEVTPQAVSNWRRGPGIPTNRCATIFKLYGVPLWQLRPHDWFEHWPMLVGTPGAPETSETNPANG